MKMILASHGDLAKAFLSAAEMIMGPQEDLCAFCIYPEASVEKFENDIQEKIETYLKQGEDVLVFTDVFFGTPFNTVVRIMDKLKFYHFTGLSLPILLEIIGMKDNRNMDEIREQLMEIGRSSFMDVNQFVEEQEE